MLDRLKNENEKSSSKSSYNKWGFLIGLMALVHILDEFVSNLSGVINVAVAASFFPDRDPVAGSIAVTEASAVLLPIVLFSFLPKTLADRYGRRFAIILGVIGMATGFLLIAFSGSNFTIYLIGQGFSLFFLNADIQLIFINEEAPEDKRARMAALIYLIGTAGTLLVAMFRFIFINDEIQNWHALYLIPGIAGIVIVLIMLFFLKESRVYQEAKKAGKLDMESGKNQNIFRSIGELYRDKPLRKVFSWRLIAMVLFFVGISATLNLNDALMETTGGFEENEKSLALVLRIVVTIVFYFLFGQLMDRIGRKIALILMQILYLGGILLFIFSIINGWVILTGIAWGLTFSGTWAFENFHFVSINEVIPTKFRGTSMAIIYVISLIFMGVIQIFLMPFLNTVYGQNTPLYFYTFMPFTILLILVIGLKFKETKGINLTTIE
jgi:MFS family permease